VREAAARYALSFIMSSEAVAWHQNAAKSTTTPTAQLNLLKAVYNILFYAAARGSRILILSQKQLATDTAAINKLLLTGV